MIRIQDAKDCGGLVLSVLPDGSMEAYLDHQQLIPVPQQARDWTLMNLGREDLPPGTPPAVLRRAGWQRLMEAAPAHFSVPYEAIADQSN